MLPSFLVPVDERKLRLVYRVCMY
uniref:Uncharacterized protein n=1 Tax=Arundo donax TaxID=35708 RepID=A0A0A9CL79_ARUDO